MDNSFSAVDVLRSGTVSKLSTAGKGQVTAGFASSSPFPGSFLYLMQERHEYSDKASWEVT